jgi:hypothetical protein
VGPRKGHALPESDARAFEHVDEIDADVGTMYRCVDLEAFRGVGALVRTVSDALETHSFTHSTMVLSAFGDTVENVDLACDNGTHRHVHVIVPDAEHPTCATGLRSSSVMLLLRSRACADLLPLGFHRVACRLCFRRAALLVRLHLRIAVATRPVRSG